MKKLILSLILMAMGCACVCAQDIYDEYTTPAKQEKLTKEEKKAQKEKEKHLKAMTDSADYKLACAALRKGQFVLMATRVDLGNMGVAEYGLDDRTNFVYQTGNEGVAQIAFNNGSPGYNGLGGITCRGTVSGTRFTTDKKGNAHYDYTITGSGLSVQINITVYAGTKQAMAYVEPVFGGSWSSVTLHGDLIPYKQAE